ncbi:MAG: ribonuclease HII [Eubacteriales bacterium]|nr:ribonuclease HII [Eubacteriales bacterium]
MGVREEKYKQHVLTLKAFDETYGTENVAGTDEVGRGPLAGDVVCAFVIMPNSPLLPRVDDSKKLSEKARNEIAAQIQELALFIGIGKATPEEIDAFNILNATKIAMRRAAEGAKPNCLLVDAVTGLGLPYPTHSIIQGDAQSYAIACASVIAKVHRDTAMIEMDKLYPAYQFAQNKGYGTKAHIEALKKYGPCPIHRQSFIKNFKDQMA